MAEGLRSCLAEDSIRKSGGDSSGVKEDEGDSRSLDSSTRVDHLKRGVGGSIYSAVLKGRPWAIKGRWD